MTKIPRSRSKKKTEKGRVAHKPGLPPLDPLRTGMPALDSITEVKEMKRSGKVFRILKTTEIDDYDVKATKKRPKSRR